MKSNRVFLALEPGKSIRAALCDFQQRLKPTCPDIRWVKRENFHLTLAFLGELPGERIELLKDALDAMVLEKAFKMTVAGIGTFGKERQPRVLWAGVMPCQQLDNLQQQTASALQAAGIRFDEKPFSAHLTLGRFKSARNLPAFLDRLGKEQAVIFGSTTVNELLVIQSQLTSEGAIYTVLHRTPLSGG